MKMSFRNALAVLAALALAPMLGGCPEPEPETDAGLVDAGNDGGGTICTAEWAPVCGEDGLTYSNDCTADAAGVAIAYEGVCEDTTECGPEACGPTPDVAACPDGSAPTLACELDAAGECAWEVGSCEPVACPEIWAPVCGVDGETYPNECTADASGVDIAYEGECETPLCEMEDCGPMPPVAPCPDGEGPTIACAMTPAGTCEWDIGTCDEICPDLWAPVCGEDGETYPNPCTAEVAGVGIAYEGECEAGCVDELCPIGELCFGDVCEPADCPAIWAPVCGVDGETYPNACSAAVEHIEVLHDGECDDDYCTEDMCGPGPGIPSEICDDGSVAGPICTIIDGECGWTITFCDDECDPATGEWCPTCASDDECRPGELCYDGMCEPGACPEYYAPVCGVDGETYSNECFAALAHVEIAYEGMCEMGPCEADDECPAGELCVAGTCEALFCPDVYAPVCGVDGMTYPNSCEAGLAHVDVLHDGACETDPGCEVIDCMDGMTCVDGECIPLCDVLCFVEDPVCGENGVTYWCGASEAECNGIGVAYEGECVDDAECRLDAECPAWTVCVDGMCEPGACPEYYAPVCGVDGETYANDCYAELARVEIAYPGPCDLPCLDADGTSCAPGEICVDGACIDAPDCAVECLFPDPVCGEDGETYWCGAPEAECNHVEVAYEGECDPTHVGCEAVLCGPDTYCEAGECIPVCEVDCFREEPVCGDDGVTYWCGAIDAECHGADVVHDGECELAEFCYSDGDCAEGLHCSVSDGDCLPDPTCPACDVCTGYCTM